MAIVKWDPFDTRTFWQWPSTIEEDDWFDNRSMDVYETDNEVVVEASVAGLTPDKVDITFEKGILWIRGEQTEEDTDDKKYYKRSSRSYSYKVAVPGNIDAKSDPDAEVRNGVLTVKFKKSEEAKPRKIPVKEM